MTREFDTLTGTDAVEALVDRWDNLGLGKVEAEYREPYLVVGRAGADWLVFISLADDTVVLVENDDATTRHIPEADRAEGEVSDGALDQLTHAFDHASGGMYPTTEDHFVVNFKDDGGRQELHVDFHSDAVAVEE